MSRHRWSLLITLVGLLVGILISLDRRAIYAHDAANTGLPDDVHSAVGVLIPAGVTTRAIGMGPPVPRPPLDSDNFLYVFDRNDVLEMQIRHGDVDRALTALEDIEDKEVVSRMRAHAAVRIATYDAPRALALARGIQTTRDRLNALTSIAVLLATSGKHSAITNKAFGLALDGAKDREDENRAFMADMVSRSKEIKEEPIESAPIAEPSVWYWPTFLPIIGFILGSLVKPTLEEIGKTINANVHAMGSHPANEQGKAREAHV